METLTEPMEVTVRLRHSRTEQEAVLSSEGDSIRLDMKIPARLPRRDSWRYFIRGMPW